MANASSAHTEDLHTEISFDSFVQLLRQDDARDRLFDVVYDPSFRGLYVAAQPSTLSKASVPSLRRTADHLAMATMLPSLTPSTDPATTSQTQAGVLGNMTQKMAQDRDDDNLPNGKPLGAVSETDKHLEGELEYDGWTDDYASRTPKDRYYELLPLDQAILVDAGHPNWQAVVKAKEEVDKKRRERKEREQRENRGRGPILADAALNGSTRGLKRKQTDSFDGPDDGDSQSPQKKAKGTSFVEKPDAMRIIHQKDVTEVPSKFLLKSFKTAIGTITADHTVHAVDCRSPPTVVTKLGATATQAVNDTMVADSTRDHAESDQSLETEGTLPQVQLSKQDVALQLIPGPSVSSSGPDYRLPVSFQASEHENAISAQQQVSNPETWQPPPEVESLRLSQNITLHPSRQLLAKVTKSREEPYVFAGKRPSKRKTAQEFEEESRPTKRRKKQSAKDERDARPASQHSKQKTKGKVQPSRRSKRLNNDISSESEALPALSAPQPVSPAYEPTLSLASAAGLSSKPSYSPHRLITVVKKEGSRPQLMMQIRINQAKLAIATRSDHP
ncbi:hypothetical protein SLS60_002070 [Paraconiothyrium brasiliense]|uniref:Uncharacterized protein n=1 Tax=Paraconiothyrium brasiliense TaxID=300254 RepID=A0ABR3S131_9PLEO